MENRKSVVVLLAVFHDEARHVERLCFDPLIVLFQLDLKQPFETQCTHLLRAENLLGQVRAVLLLL